MNQSIKFQSNSESGQAPKITFSVANIGNYGILELHPKFQWMPVKFNSDKN